MSMMAGPNKGQKPAYFADWPVLEAELRAYLAEREKGEPEGSGDDQPARRNAVLNFLSVDPSKMALENSPDSDEWDGEVDTLAYSELTRYGYGYLIEPMMKAGGYATVSERMGIELNIRTLKDREYYERKNPPVGLKKKETDGFLTLGRARDERLDSMAEVDREERRRALFEKQAMMDKSRKTAAQAAKPTLLKSNKPMTGRASKAGAEDDVFRPPGLAPELQGPSEWKSSAGADDTFSEPLLFSFTQRANTVAVFACCALAFGRGTVEALDKGILPAEVAEAAVPASLFLVGLNVAGAAVSGSMAKSKGRSVPLWVFKGALAGLTSVLELKGLPDVGSSASSPSAAGESTA